MKNKKIKIFIFLITTIVISGILFIVSIKLEKNQKIIFQKFETEKQKFETEKQKFETEKQKFETEKKRQQSFVIIKTDGNHSFKLNENNNLFFYINNNNNKIKIEITGILNDEKIQCYKTIISNSHKINLNEFSKRCKSAIYFIGKLGEYSFYFGFDQKKNNKKKNLLVLPSTNFFVYADNIFNITPYSISENFIINLNDIPISSNDFWPSKISQSIHNISNIVKDYEIILDYEFENHKLDKYNLIILPLHQEYVSDGFIENLLGFLNKENKAVLSIGGANFYRDFKLINNDKIIIKKDEFKNTKKYNLNTFDYGLNKNCLYLDDEQITIGEITEPLVNKNIKYFFPKIKCDDDKIIPLLSVQNFDNINNSKLIHILSDEIGINFTKIDYLKSKILSELNNILRNYF